LPGFRGRVDSQKCVLHVTHYDPTQRFSLPIWGLPLGKRQGLESTAPPGDQASQHSACKVGCRDTLARVTAGEPDTGRGIKSHRGHPVARHPDRTSPRMGELDPFQHREPFDDSTPYAGMRLGVAILIVRPQGLYGVRVRDRI